MQLKLTKKRLLEASAKSTLLANQAELIIRNLLKERKEMEEAVDNLIFEPSNPDRIQKIYELRKAQEQA